MCLILFKPFPNIEFGLTPPQLMKQQQERNQNIHSNLQILLHYKNLVALKEKVVCKAMVINFTVSQTSGSFPSMRAGAVFLLLLARRTREYH